MGCVVSSSDDEGSGKEFDVSDGSRSPSLPRIDPCHSKKDEHGSCHEDKDRSCRRYSQKENSKGLL